MRMFANHGALIKHQHEIERINSRLDGIQAGILDVKLKYIADWNERRIENAGLYHKYLNGFDKVILPSVRDNAKHIFHVYCILAEKRDLLKEFLLSQGIQTALHYPTPLPLLNAYKELNYSTNDIPIASEYMNKLLSLPMYPELKEEEIKYISEKIIEFYNKN